MSPQDARVFADCLLSMLEQELQTTASVLAAVPTEKLDYQPDAKSKSALGLLRHIALEDEWILNSVAEGHFGPVPDDSDGCGVMTPQDAVVRYTQRIPTAIARVRSLSDDDLVRPIDFFGTVLPAVIVLSVMVRHSIHHRGQLSTYLRAMGGKVPSIYGPSADTQMAVAS